jgi:beta-lactamase class D
VIGSPRVPFWPHPALVLLALSAVACAPPAPAPSVAHGEAWEREVDLSAHFAGVDPGDATFVVLHAASGEIMRYNPARARMRFIPASTYKIPNSLIALETGVATGPDHRIPWDSTAPRDSGFWASVWSQDHTLRSAMRHSVYWYYQALARQIGAERMQRYLDRFGYGNRNMGGGLDRFWLHGELRISPDEQIRFLARMYRGELGLSERSTQVVKDLLVLEETPAYRLSGKTGTADVTPTRELAWLVGYVEHGGEVWFYALNMEGEQVWEQWGSSTARLALVRDLLQDLGVLPFSAATRPE